MQTTNASGPGRTQSKRNARRKPREIVKTIAFDSAGPRKYAIQLQKAGNGNPCLKIVEGIPQDDGSHRKIYLTIWSEDFEAFFTHLEDIRRFIDEQGISTPKGHKTPTTMNSRRGSKGDKAAKANRGKPRAKP